MLRGSVLGGVGLRFARLGGVRCLNDDREVPDVLGQRRRRKRVDDYGYTLNWMRIGDGPLPRHKAISTPIRGHKQEIKDEWSEVEARFGQSDYIDILGDGSLHPAQLLYHVPGWLRGFPGNHKASELVRLIHYRNCFQQRLKRFAPRRYHNLQKRISHLMSVHNYQRSDEIREERELGLWNEAPDYFYKDKTRRSFKMTPHSAT